MREVYSTEILLRVTDWKYRKWLVRFEKTAKTLKPCLKNAFRELFSKILFRFSKNFKAFEKIGKK